MLQKLLKGITSQIYKSKYSHFTGLFGLHHTLCGGCRPLVCYFLMFEKLGEITSAQTHFYLSPCPAQFLNDLFSKLWELEKKQAASSQLIIQSWNQRTEEGERVKHGENEALHFGKEINWDRDMLTLISTVGTCLHYFRHVLLIVFTLYNILSGNIAVFEGLAGIRGVLFCFVEGIIPLKYSNIFILIWKWI